MARHTEDDIRMLVTDHYALVYTAISVPDCFKPAPEVPGIVVEIPRAKAEWVAKALYEYAMVFDYLEGLYAEESVKH